MNSLEIPPNPPASTGRINGLESLRGLMALWVVVGHTIKNTGFSDKDAFLFRFLIQPGLAVDVFIILSGFVIFFLLDRWSGGYRAFVIRRFFRLAPIYLCMVLVSWKLLDWQTNVISSFPFQTQHIANNLTIHLNAKEHLAEQLIAHVLMLHGLISNKLLPSSEYALLGAAWSISVEWQFYLVAPFLFFLVVHRRWAQLSWVVIGICLLRSINYGGEGFAINQAAYFMIGIASYYLWKHSHAIAIDVRLVEFLALLGAGFIYLYSPRYLSITIWLLALSCVVAERKNQFTTAQSFTSNVLNLPALQWLGKISYSVYLTHMLVFYTLSSAVLTMAPQINKSTLLAVLLPTVPLATIALSALTYRFIEQPGITFGKRWKGRRLEVV